MAFRKPQLKNLTLEAKAKGKDQYLQIVQHTKQTLCYIFIFCLNLRDPHYTISC